jgi:hypothetical protein
MNLQNWDRANSVWDLIETLLSVKQDSDLPDETIYKRLKERLNVNQPSKTDSTKKKK